MFKARTLLTAFAATTLAICGCGGSTMTTGPSEVANGSGATTGQTLSSSELTVKADEVCRRLTAQRNSINIKTTREYATVLPKLAAAERAGFAELSKLKAPAQLASDWQRLVSEGQTLAHDIARLALYASTSDRRSARATYQSGITAQQAIRAIAARDGFKDCV
jgi:hypothetical protein